MLEVVEKRGKRTIKYSDFTQKYMVFTPRSNGKCGMRSFATREEAREYLLEQEEQEFVPWWNK